MTSNSISLLPDSFHISSLFELQKKISSNPSTPVIPEQPLADDTCPKHNDPLRVFCCTCIKLICRDCAITPEHRNHEYNLVTDLFPLAKKSILTKVQGVHDKVTMIRPAVEIIMQRENTIKSEGNETKNKISRYTQMIIGKLHDYETELHKEVDETIATKCKWLQIQREDITDSLDQLLQLSVAAEQCVENGTQVGVLSDKNKILHDIQEANNRVAKLMLTPVENSNIEFVNNDIVCEVGHVKSVFLVDKCRVNVSPSNATTLWMAGITQSLKLIISIDGDNGHIIPMCLLNINMQSVKQGENLNIIDITHNQSEYTITFQPEMSGKHDVRVFVCDQEISGSPIPFVVSYSPNLSNRRSIVIPKLNRPHGCVLMDQATIAIVEYGAHRVTVLDNEGNRIRSIGSRGTRPGQFTHPRGIALSADQNSLLVTDNHRIQQLTFDGEAIMSAGGSNHGSSRTDFYNPTGIAVNPSNGNIYVADTDNNRVKVLNNNLEVLMSFGRSTNPSERLNGPYDVQLDNAGDVYVVDSLHHCVKKYSPKGRLLSQIGSIGESPGSLGWPTSIAISSYEYLYITEQDNMRVSIFSRNGDIISCFSGHFSGPQDIYVDSDGNVYVSDTYDDKLHIFYA